MPLAKSFFRFLKFSDMFPNSSPTLLVKVEKCRIFSREEVLGTSLVYFKLSKPNISISLSFLEREGILEFRFNNFIATAETILPKYCILLPGKYLRIFHR